MTLLTVAATVVLALMAVIAVWNVLTAPRLDRFAPRRDPPPASILVPARNEAANLRSTLPALLRLDYPRFEVVVLDDGSTDGTAAVVDSFARAANGRLRLVRGRPLPDGWIGKCWACQQLAGAAAGEILVFCDADVTARPGALRATAAALRATSAGALTAFPRQRFSGWLDAAIVPVVTQLPILALLPLSLVGRSGDPSLSVGNGQWFAFTREAYRASGGHAAVRSRVVEDVALARRVKAAGFRILPTVARDLLEVRMYRDAGALREGFTKNLYALVGARSAALLAAVAFVSLTLVYPWVAVAVGVPGAILPLGLLLLVRACGVMAFGDRPISVLLHPAGAVGAVGLLLASYVAVRRGRVRWKDRSLGAVAATLAADPPDGSSGAGR